MSSNPLKPSFRYPSALPAGVAHDSVVKAIQNNVNGLVDVNQAIVALKTRIDALKTGSTTATTTGGSSSIVVNGSSFPGQGGVNDQTGVTSYTIVAHDNGILLILNDASPVAVSINSGLATPYYLFITNFGAGAVTLTPTSGLINGAASLVMKQYDTLMAVFDGTNWDTTALPVSAEFVNAQTGTTYTFQDSDRSKLVTFFNASPIAGTLPQAGASSLFISGWFCDVDNYGAGTLTVTPTTSTIDGAATLVLTTNQGVRLVSDGANYFSIRGIGSGGGSGTVTSVALTMPAEFSVAGSPIVGAGTLAVTKANESANTAYLGPTSGGAAQPTFRAIIEADLPASSQVGVFGATIAAADVGNPQYVTVPYGCTITSWTAILDVAGAVSLDVWFLAGSAPPVAPSIPLVGNKISASAPIAIAATNQSASGGATAISTWTKPLTQFGTLAFNLASITTATKVTIQIQVSRS